MAAGRRPVGVTQYGIRLAAAVHVPDDPVLTVRVPVDGHRVRMVRRDHDQRVQRIGDGVGHVHGPGKGDRLAQRHLGLRRK